MAIIMDLGYAFLSILVFIVLFIIIVTGISEFIMFFGNTIFLIPLFAMITIMSCVITVYFLNLD